MSLMDLVYKIIPQLNKNYKEKEKLQEGVVAVQNAYDESDTKKEANQNAMNTVIETIQEHPEMPVGEFLKMIQQNTDLSDSSLVEIIKQIPDVKSEEATVEAVKKVDLASEAITEIIQEAPVSTVTAQKIAEQIPDKDIQKEQQAKIERWVEEEQRKQFLEKEKEIVSQLEEIYDTCDEMNDNMLVEKINKLHIKTRTEKINEKLKHITAKKVALDCMKYGGPKIPTMMQIMPATDMLEANLPFLAEKEYNKIKSIYDEEGKDYHVYETKEKKLVKEKILENIARKVAKNFEEMGDISVPQIEQLRNLNEEEVQVFIDTVKTFCHTEQLNEEDVDRIKRQLKGDTVEEWENLKRMLEKMKPKNREIAVRNFLQVLKSNEEKTEEQKELDKIISEIGIYIKKLPNEKKINTARAIHDVLEQQQEAINMWKKHKYSEELEAEEDSKDTKGDGR